MNNKCALYKSKRAWNIEKLSKKKQQKLNGKIEGKIKNFNVKCEEENFY